jgi:hypothetical protein
LRPPGESDVVTEWIDISSNRWRLVMGNRTVVFTGVDYVTLHGPQGYLRRGSLEFIGSLSVGAPAVSEIREKLTSQTATREPGAVILSFETPDGTKVEARTTDAISASEADARGLFAIPADGITTTAVEVEPGTPTSLPVSAYWFGNSLDSHAPVTAVEHQTKLTEAMKAEGWSDRDETIDYVVFYELASAAGRSSALPDQEQPAGEIQVSSKPIDLPAAQGAIDAANGQNGDLTYEPWPRTTIKLASGEEATVIPDVGEGSGTVRAGFLVITPSALVTVTGSFRLDQIPEIASRLKPL